MFLTCHRRPASLGPLSILLPCCTGLRMPKLTYYKPRNVTGRNAAAPLIQSTTRDFPAKSQTRLSPPLLVCKSTYVAIADVHQKGVTVKASPDSGATLSWPDIFLNDPISENARSFDQYLLIPFVLLLFTAYPGVCHLCSASCDGRIRFHIEATGSHTGAQKATHCRSYALKPRPIAAIRFLSGAARD
jgi:hypothetical protein